jgi:hypothetical protein
MRHCAHGNAYTTHTLAPASQFEGVPLHSVSLFTAEHSLAHAQLSSIILCIYSLHLAAWRARSHHTRLNCAHTSPACLNCVFNSSLDRPRTRLPSMPQGVTMPWTAMAERPFKPVASSGLPRPGRTRQTGGTGAFCLATASVADPSRVSLIPIAPQIHSGHTLGHGRPHHGQPLLTMAGHNCIHDCLAMHGAPLLVTPCTAD